jgi:hypothetical protein
MAFLALRCLTAWTEDRATQSCDPSAVSGAETEGRADAVRSAARTYQPLRDRHESDKPSRQDAATRPAGCASRFANARRPKFQFTLNQYRTYGRLPVNRLPIMAIQEPARPLIMGAPQPRHVRAGERQHLRGERCDDFCGDPETARRKS